MSSTSNVGRDSAKVMNRANLTRILVAKLQAEEAVIGGIGFSNWDLWVSGQRPQNFYMLGSMGLAAPIALGVAIAQPQRRVFALEGDGSLLMQLGALSTIAKVAPKNLCVIVWDNGSYHITGGQDTLAASTADLVEIARACGLADSAWASDEEHFETLVDAALREPGPSLIAARIDLVRPAGATERDPAKIRINFMRGMGADGAKEEQA